MNITLHSGEELVFDVSKIVEAVSKALLNFTEVIEEITEMVEGAIYTAMHSVVHWLMHYFYSVKENVKRSFSYNPMLSIAVLTSIGLRTKVLVRISSLIAFKTRTTYLLRTQDRGSNDSDGIVVYSNIAA